MHTDIPAGPSLSTCTVTTVPHVEEPQGHFSQQKTSSAQAPCALNMSNPSYACPLCSTDDAQIVPVHEVRPLVRIKTMNNYVLSSLKPETSRLLSLSLHQNQVPSAFSHRRTLGSSGRAAAFSAPGRLAPQVHALQRNPGSFGFMDSLEAECVHSFNLSRQRSCS